MAKNLEKQVAELNADWAKDFLEYTAAMEEKFALQEKALKVIEHLVSDDFCEDFECRVGLHNDFRLSEEDIKLVYNKLSLIYEISHGVNPHSCYNVHDNWREKLIEMYNKLEEVHGQ